MTRRPLLTACIFYIIGIVLSNYFEAKILIVLSIIIYITFLNLNNLRKNLIFGLIVIFVFNFAVIYSQYKISSNRSSLLELSNEDVIIEATFLENIKSENKFNSFVINVHKVNNQDIKHEKTRVNYYKNMNLNYNYGDLIKISGKIKIPDEQRNPGGFNYRKYLLTKNIYATITANNIEIIERNGGHYSTIKKASLFIKNRIIYVINKSLPKEKASLLESILLSKKDFLDESVKIHFQNTGLSHLMAVSGLHVGYIIILFLYIFKKVKLKELSSTILLTIILILFIFITGARASVIRAVVMSLMIIYGRLIRRKSDVLTSLSFSAFLILMYNPIILYDLGFQLSYTATLSIIILYSKVKQLISFLPKYLNDIVAVTLSAQIGILPVTIYYFNQVSLISVFANVLAVPVGGIIVILGLCMILIGQVSIFLGKFFGGATYLLLTILMSIAKIGSHIPFSNITVSTPKILSIIAYYLLIGLFVFKFKLIKDRINVKIIYRLIMIVFLFLIGITLYPKSLEVSFLDVGQGDAIYIKTPTGKVMLVDAGGFSSNKSDAGENIIAPFLLDKGIDEIDIIILSHTDSDHICGLDDIIDVCRVKNVVMSSRVKDNNVLELLNDNNTKVISIKNNGKIEVEKNLFFKIFSPEKEYKDKNDNESLVVELNYKSRKFLFAGDISWEVEKEMLESLKEDYDVLKVAHHGSKTSTSNELLDRIKPSIAVISVGKNNIYNHPAKSVVDRLKEKSIDIFRTDLHGCISVFSNGENIKVKTMNGDKMYEL